MEIVYGYLLLINAITLVIMLVDKRKAIKNKRRIPERRLLFLCAIGGSLGGYLAMHLFRHKTKHPKFYLSIPLMLLLQAGLLLYFSTK